ncbi:MAG TPA: addiction module protein [Pseudomonadota bacterium]|jgi:hypothetical protein|nr:addiction module protein [Pseudomonadota bacterium]
MKSAAEVEIDLMNLPAAERARLVMSVWESLEGDSNFAASRGFDPEGIALAVERDAELEAGAAEALSYEAFIERTGGRR